jgi:hypothetical protein
MIRYRNREKGVSIKLGNPVTQNHVLDVDKKIISWTTDVNRMVWETPQGCC